MEVQYESQTRPWQGVAGICIGLYIIFAAVVTLNAANKMLIPEKVGVITEVLIEQQEKKSGRELTEVEKKKIESLILSPEIKSGMNKMFFFMALLGIVATLSFWLRWKIGIIVFIVFSALSLLRILEGDLTSVLFGAFQFYVGFICLNHPYYKKKKE